MGIWGWGGSGAQLSYFLGMLQCCKISGNHYHPLSCKQYHSWIYRVLFFSKWRDVKYQDALSSVVVLKSVPFFLIVEEIYVFYQEKSPSPPPFPAARHLTWVDLFPLSNSNQDQNILFRKIPNCVSFHYLELLVSWGLLWNSGTNINKLYIKGIVWSNCVSGCEVSCSVLKQLCPI